MAREREPGGLDLLILSLLSEREMYGYEIVTELARRSDETFSLREGTLYPLLHRLEKEGAVAAREVKAGGRPRRYYRLTKKGGEKLSEREAEWVRYSSAVNAVLTSFSTKPCTPDGVRSRMPRPGKSSRTTHRHSVWPSSQTENNKHIRTPNADDKAMH